MYIHAYINIHVSADPLWVSRRVLSLWVCFPLLLSSPLAFPCGHLSTPTPWEYLPHDPEGTQSTAEKNYNFQLASNTIQSQKKSAQGIQKATKKTPKSRLDINQFTKYVKK